ncbi:MAG: hypothetical protein ABI540_10585 [Spartobacteria bacterium]
MTRKMLLAQSGRWLPLAARWAEALERRILREGVPLTEDELSDARALGVRDPGKVRLLCLARVPMPDDLTLRAAASAVEFLTPATRGLALRYGIFVRADCWRDGRLIAHELAHTEQYERLGGIEEFLRQYLTECLTVGYPAAPMEQEVVAAVYRLDAGRVA